MMDDLNFWRGFWIGVAVGSTPLLMLSAWIATQWRQSCDDLLEYTKYRFNEEPEAISTD